MFSKYDRLIFSLIKKRNSIRLMLVISWKGVMLVGGKMVLVKLGIWFIMEGLSRMFVMIFVIIFGFWILDSG